MGHFRMLRLLRMVVRIASCIISQDPSNEHCTVEGMKMSDFYQILSRHEGLLEGLKKR